MTRPPRTALVLALLAVAVVTMLVFEAPIMRLIGVLSLFGFVVAGVFAIADPGFLDPDADEDAGRSERDPVAVADARRSEES